MKRRLAQFLRRTANSIDPPPPNPMFSPWMLGATGKVPTAVLRFDHTASR